MVNKEPGQIEHPGHPRDDGDDMQGLQPVVHCDVSDFSRRVAMTSLTLLRSQLRASERARLIIRSTCAIGVCGTMPWPRLKTKGPPAKAASTASTARSSAAPPATR